MFFHLVLPEYYCTTEFGYVYHQFREYYSTSGSVESNNPKLRTNPNFEQTQSSNKSKLRTNPNFE